MGRFALGNWPGITNKIIGFLALLVILIGARMTVWTETKQQEYSKNLRSAVILLLVGEIGYWIYSAAPQATDIGGFKAFTSSYRNGHCGCHLCVDEYV